MNHKPDLNGLEALIGYRFKNPAFLLQALTHSSYRKEQGAPWDYERLEFLGDAVLELSASEYLFARYPEESEGALTRHRAQMVCEPSLAYVAECMGYGKYLRLSAGEEKTGGRSRSSILCDVTEAIIGAVYLDGGFSEARALVERTVFSREKELPGERKKDSKTLLQELVQQDGPELPVYTVTEEKGLPHDRSYTVELSYRGEVISCGKGRSKKAAEQDAAEAALAVLGREKAAK